MIKKITSGSYSLTETFDRTKILTLDDAKYAWINAHEIGDILVATKRKFSPLQVVAQGNYRLYDVKNEPDLTDLEHLELFVGDGKWQGYLLPTGLPNGRVRKRIVATKETITNVTH